MANRIKRPNAQSQMGRILITLENNWWTCGSTFQRMYLPTYAQRISDLKKLGYNIIARPCDDKSHTHTGQVAQYTLQKRQTLF